MAADLHHLRARIAALVEAGQPPSGDATRAELGQVFTPVWLAGQLAELALPKRPAGSELRVADLGAGMGALSAALVVRLVELGWQGTLRLDCVELDPALAQQLASLLDELAGQIELAGVELAATVHHADAVGWALRAAANGRHADVVVLNPPYGKVGPHDPARLALAGLGVRITDRYAAFMAVAAELACPDGGRVASLTPRSFANGAYFGDLRRHLWQRLAVQAVWVCSSRDAFKGKDVLQETMILAGQRGAQAPARVPITVGRQQSFLVDAAVVKPAGPDAWLRLPQSPTQARLLARHDRRPQTLDSLGVEVAVGPIVVYRADQQLRPDWQPGRVAFVEARHVSGGRLRWPHPTRPNALAAAPMGGRWDFPQGHYVLLRRMSSKEEPRRVVATHYRPGDTPGERVTFGLSLTVLHAAGAGLDADLAAGLAEWLNGEEVEQAIRAWNGSINVNASDLRALRLPSRAVMLAAVHHP